MRATLLYELRTRIESFLMSRESFVVTKEFRRSTRGVGDAIERLIVSEFGEIAGGLVDSFDTNFGRRAMEDISFRLGDEYYALDIKTHRLEAGFHMPNLVSVKRLMDFYESEENIFVVTMVGYSLDKLGKLTGVKVTLEPIEWLEPT